MVFSPPKASVIAMLSIPPPRSLLEREDYNVVKPTKSQEESKKEKFLLL